ncbi:MAG: hypothetical protein ACXVEF_07300 [Polyangiales bacterium]
MATRRIALGLALLFVASTAGATVTWDANSKHYGKTTVTVPPGFYGVRVTPAGRVINLGGSKVTVAHEELTNSCHKVESVTTSFAPLNGFATAQPSPAYPATCSFGVAKATFPIAYPIGATGVGRMQEIDALKEACRKRVAAKVIIPHPLLAEFDVTLEYAGGGVDQLHYSIPMIALTCEPCPVPTFPTNNVRFAADREVTIDLATLVTGGSAPLSFKVAPPPGMTQKGNLLIGTVAEGSYTRKLEVTGQCATGTSTVTRDFAFVAITLSKPGPPSTKL